MSTPITTPSAKDLLLGGGAPAASFDERPAPTGVGAQIGTSYEGRVIKEEVSQMTKMSTTPGAPAELQFWDPPHNTRPKFQVILTIQNPAYVTPDNDEGLLRVFLKGGALQAAQKTARDLKAESFLHGYMRLTWTGLQPAKTAGFNPAKVFSFDFQPGVAPAHAAAIQGTDPGAGVPQTQFPPAQQVAATPPAQQPALFQAPTQQAPVFAPPVQQAPQAPAFQPPVVTQQQAPQFQAPPQQQAPAAPQFAAGEAAVTGILGAVNVTPLPPETQEQIRQLYAAGLTDAASIVAAFAQHGQTVSAPQVEQVLQTITI